MGLVESARFSWLCQLICFPIHSLKTPLLANFFIHVLDQCLYLSLYKFPLRPYTEISNLDLFRREG